MDNATKAAALKQIWRKTSKDYRSVFDGVKHVMVNRGGACALVALEKLTDAEIERLK